MRPIKFDQDECCKAMHTTPMLEETVVARDGHLANVIVYVSKGAERHPRGVPAEPVLLDQTGCMYSPHVFTVTVGQRVLVRNSDRTTHNVHVAPKVNDDWNKSQLIGATDLTHSFDTPELPVRIKCDIHGWMLSWAGVFDHPFHAVTGEDGTATLRLPPGDYEISAWHEYPKFAGPAPQKVTVAGNEPREIEFVFEPK
jgi:plastocyanin